MSSTILCKSFIQSSAQNLLGAGYKRIQNSAVYDLWISAAHKLTTQQQKPQHTSFQNQYINISLILLLKIYKLQTGFEPVDSMPSGFQVQRLNHSATTVAKRFLHHYYIDFSSLLLAKRAIMLTGFEPVRATLPIRNQGHRLNDSATTTANTTHHHDYIHFS